MINDADATLITPDRVKPPRRISLHATWEAGLKLPTQVADGRSTCFSGAAIGIADVEQHVYAAPTICA